MVIEERTVKNLVDALRARRWSDAEIGEEVGVSGATVWRWRQGQRRVQSPRMVVRALEELLRRP